jgi:arylsulfatase A-like enzyme
MSRPPNIVLLFCDQLRADALGAYGHPFVRTPAIDALAASGTVFTSAYTPSPVCVPARCSLITGLEPGTTECYDNGFAMPDDAPTLMSRLAERGYRTHGVGKMHFTPDAHAMRGFHTRDTGEEAVGRDRDDYRAFVAERGYGYVERPLGLRSEMYYVPQLSPVPEELHFSHWVADRSIDFLDGADPGEPFFLWSSFIAPHPPFAPPGPWHTLYPPTLMPDPHRPQGEAGLLTAHNRMQNRYKFRDGGTDRRLLQLIQAYYLASVSFIDSQIARIMAALESRHGLDNTLIVLSADHGEFLGDYGSFGKRSFLDCAARVPLICTGPGFGAGRVDAPASLIDVAPTMWQAAGVDADVDGQPLGELEPDRVIHGQFQDGPLGLYASLNREYKYIYSAADRREYLVDRIRDRAETRNIAYSSRARDALVGMRELAQDHHRGLADLDLDDAAANIPLAGRFGRHVDDTAVIDTLDADPDSAGLILGEPTPDGAPYDQYWR